MDDVQRLLEDILRAIVRYPDDIEITKEMDEMGVMFRVWVNRSDMGLVIGKGGETAVAIKHIFRMAGYKNRSNIAVKIEEPNK